METNLIYAFTGGIRTYPHLLESRDIVLMQLMVTCGDVIYARGWRTVNGCTRAGQVRVMPTLDG
jgi:hypothetical protein